MTAWILYALGLGALASGAAETLARAARRRGHAERWIWVGALGGSVLLPTLLPFLPRLTPAAVGRVTLEGLTAASPAGPAPASPALPLLPTLLLGAWAVASLVLASRLLRSARALCRIVERSIAVRQRPVEVRLTQGTGPAVAGLLRPVVLLPAGFPHLPHRHRAWVLRHEMEHLRAGDPVLVWASRLAQVLVPWNPAVWFLGRRLREGLEFDCDRRLLRRRPDPRGYGETLLSMVVPSPSAILPVAAFHEPTLPLMRRIVAMTTPTHPLRRRHLALLSGAVALVLAGACEFSPTYTIADDDGTAALAPEAARESAGEPTFTPYTVAPDITNRREVVAALEAEYPPVLREAGIGGTATVWFFIDETGEVGEVRLQQSSGHEPLDQAALRVGRSIRFSPARNGEKPVPVWVAFPITFQVR